MHSFSYLLLVSHKLLIAVMCIYLYIMSDYLSEQNRATKKKTVFTPSSDDVHTHNTSSGVKITTLVWAWQRCGQGEVWRRRNKCAFSKWVVSVLQEHHQNGWSEIKNKTKGRAKQGRGDRVNRKPGTLKMVALIWLSTSPPQRERRGMRKGFHMGFRLFFTTCG